MAGEFVPRQFLSKYILFLKFFLQPGLAPWHTVFYITAGLLGIELVIFSCFASGEEQAWNKSSHETLEDGHGDNEENQIELQKLSSGSPALDDKSINEAFFDITCNSTKE